MKTESINKLSVLALFIGIVALVLGWLFIPQEFISSDPWAYSRIAHGIAEKWDFGSSHVFNHRLGVVLPVAIAYAIFGVDILTTNLWPLMAAIIILVVAWLAMPDVKSKIIGVVLTIAAAPLWIYSTSLYPDLIASAFMALSIYFLTKREVGGSNIRLIAIGIFGTVSLFIAFLAKESAYWVLPVWVIAIYEDYRNRSMPPYFWQTVIITGILLAFVYLVFCHIIFGDVFARFRAVESLTGVHLWAWDKISVKQLIKRLTIEPLALYYATYGIVFFFAIAALSFAPPTIRYWSYYLIMTMFFFWFGSTSFSSYEPMPLVDRMTLPSFPAIVILSSFLVSIAFKQEKKLDALAFLSFGILLFSFSTPTLSFFYGALKNPLTETKISLSVKSEAVNSQSDKLLLVTSDQRSSACLLQFFAYNYPNNLDVISATTRPDQINLLEYDKIFIYLNKGRSEFLKSAYGQVNADNAILSLNLPIIISDGSIMLFSLPPDRINEFSALIDTLAGSSTKCNTC